MISAFAGMEPVTSQSRASTLFLHRLSEPCRGFKKCHDSGHQDCFVRMTLRISFNMVIMFPRFFFQTMASAEGVECPVCCELFDDQNICPRMLSCGHSFCTSCLERLLTMAMIDKIPCPTCRVEVNLPEAGVAGLPKNFALLSIANDKPRQEGGEALFICEVCDSKHPATFWCFNCKEDMCKNAARFHTRSKASRDHQLISLQSAAATECCPKHKEPFRLFDEACGHVVCRGCIQLDHKDHNCSSLAKAASKCRQEMKELATKVSARTEVIKDAELQVKQASLDMKKAYDEKNAEIQRLFKEVSFSLFFVLSMLTNLSFRIITSASRERKD